MTPGNKKGSLISTPPLRAVTALGLAFLLAGAEPLLAEGGGLPDAPGAPTVPVFAGAIPQAAGTVSATAPKSLHIVILEGEGALNNIKERTAREPIVQIEDENHKPVAGASVTFLLQDGGGGAGGSFNSAASFTTVSDAQGRAVGRGFHPNTTEGKYAIEVSAAVGMLIATILISETNVSEGGGAGGAPAGVAPVVSRAHRGVPRWVIIGGAIIVVGVVVAAVLLTNDNKGATITPGTGTITP
jgi:hypothetical protein